MKTKKVKAAGTSEGNSAKLKKLFQKELNNMYWVEKRLCKELPRMIKKAQSEKLKIALEDHLVETEVQLEKVKKIFELIGKRSGSKKCIAMDGILQEAAQLMEEFEKGAVSDSAIISASQKVEHYEISVYGTLQVYAMVLDLAEVVPLLGSLLKEEKRAAILLTKLTPGILKK